MIINMKLCDYELCGFGFMFIGIVEDCNLFLLIEVRQGGGDGFCECYIGFDFVIYGIFSGYFFYNYWIGGWYLLFNIGFFCIIIIC